MGKTKAIRKTVKAAKMGKPYAQYTLGLYYETGRIRESDMTAAAYWIGLAAQNGCADAHRWIEDYYHDDDALVQANA